MSVLVTVAVDKNHDVRVYRIKETTAGVLWFHVFRYVPVGTPCLLGYEAFLSGLSVRAEHAEDMTGLRCPAAWDRLREMVQDSSEYKIP